MGLLDDIVQAQQASQRSAMTHRPAKKLTGKEMIGAAQMGTAPLPVVGDVVGLLGDAAMYANYPEERTLGNFALTGLGMIPFMPGAGSLRVFRGQHGDMADVDPFKATKRPVPSFTTDRKVAEMYAQGAGNFGRPVSSGKVTEWDLDPSKFLDVRKYLDDGKRFGVEDALTPAAVKQLAKDLKLSKSQVYDLLSSDAWSRQSRTGWDGIYAPVRANTPAVMPAYGLLDGSWQGIMMRDELLDRGYTGMALRGSIGDSTKAPGNVPWGTSMLYDEYRPLTSEVLKRVK
jgi:hypothetical protein